MQCYTVFSATANFYHQPHLLVHCNQLKTISALAEEIRVLSMLSASPSFPLWPLGGVIQLEASGQVLDQNAIIQDVIPDPRAVALFASISYPPLDPSGQRFGLSHAAQHIVFEDPTFDGKFLEPNTNRVEERGRS